jgi:hypothetical protein
MEAYYQGIWRMDWGFGNPNKTASLIATLMVAVWGLACFRRWGFWAALALFTGLGVGLIRTMSRGGLVALCAGLGILVWNLPRPWPKRRVGAVVLAVWGMIGAAVLWEAHARFGQGLVEPDRSITNRLELWKVAPRMMADAPGGWGLGNAGRAYMHWYQPTGRSEEYRTLVNSHLTWLVEFGWPLRFLYLFGWWATFLLCWPGRLRNAEPGTRTARADAPESSNVERRSSRGTLCVPFAVWVAFGVAAAFSSVAESPWLWVVPGMAFAFAVGARVRDRRWPGARAWALAGGGAALGVGVLFLLGMGDSGVRVRGGRVLLGRGEPSVWVIADPKVMGRDYGKALRAARASRGESAVGVVESVEALGGVRGKVLVVGGLKTVREAAGLREALGKLTRAILLNPSFGPAEIEAGGGALRGRVEVVFGEFSASPFAGAWEAVATVRRVEGAGDFLPSWADFVFAAPRGGGVPD